MQYELPEDRWVHCLAGSLPAFMLSWEKGGCPCLLFSEPLAFSCLLAPAQGLPEIQSQQEVPEHPNISSLLAAEEAGMGSTGTRSHI